MGIPVDDVEAFFESLGGSWKKRAFKTNGGRTIHGEKGEGRFKAFALGERVTWVSRHGGKRFSISGEKLDLKRLSISDTVSSANTGCTVEIENIVRDFEIWTEDGFADQVRNVFPLQLYEDPNLMARISTPETLSGMWRHTKSRRSPRTAKRTRLR